MQLHRTPVDAAALYEDAKLLAVRQDGVEVRTDVGAPQLLFEDRVRLKKVCLRISQRLPKLLQL